MPEYSINKNGTITTHSKYTRRGVCTLLHVFPNLVENTKKLLIKKPSAKNVRLASVYKVRTSSVLVRRIFSKMLEKMLLRVADGDLFMFPGTTGAHIVLKSIPENEVKMLRQSGKYKDFDIVRAKFKIPRFAFDFGAKNNRYDHEIYVPKIYRDKAYTNAENCSLSWISIPKTLENDF